jgi:hypothetical protein
MKQARAISTSPMLVLLVSALAHAADTTEPVRVEYSGRPDCPDKSTFMAQVRSRSARIRDAEPGESARAFQVTLSQTAGRFHGELLVVDANTEASAERVRAIDGDSCEEVVDALALFTVLAVDPTAILDADTRAVDRPPGQGSAGASEPSAPTPASPEPPLARTNPAVERTPPKGQPPRDDARYTEYRAVAGIHGGVMAVGATALLSAVSGFTEFGVDDDDSPGIAFAPLARISLLLTTETAIQAPGGSARLRWTKLSLDLCPLVARANRSLAFRPCFTASEGLLHATGSIDEPKSVTTQFRTLGALARGEWAVLDRVLLELALGVEFPLRRDSFYFEPNTPVYEVPAVVGVVTLGGGFRFL